MRKASLINLSFTRVAPVVEVSGGATRDLQALPGHLATLPGRLAALPGHLRALPGHLAALPGRLRALPGQLRAFPGHLAVLPRHLWVWPGHLWAWPGHLRAFLASAGLTQAFENHGRTGRTADPWSEPWSRLAAWDHCAQLIKPTSRKGRAFLPSFYRSRHRSILFHECPLFSSVNSHAKKGKINTSKNFCFPWPSRIRIIPASGSFRFAFLQVLRLS